MSGARVPGARGSSYMLVDVVIATPALVAITSWIVQLVVGIGPSDRTYEIMTVGLLAGVGLSVVTALVGTLRLVLSAAARSARGYVATSLAIVVGLGGVAMFIALVTHR
jgi:hypothetical protein